MNQAIRTSVDLRGIAPLDRHPLLASAFQRLPAGGAMELIDDQDPQALQQQFQIERHGQFTWQLLEQGGQAWRVRIAKTGQDCCGHCTCG